MNNADSFFKTIRDEDALPKQPYIMFQNNDLTKEPRIVYVVHYKESYLYESTLTGEYIGCAEDEQVYKIPNYKYPGK